MVFGIHPEDVRGVVSSNMRSTCSRLRPCDCVSYGWRTGKRGTNLGFWDQEVRVDQAAEAKATPDEEDLSTKVALVRVDHVGGNDGNNAVPEPVAGGGESNTSRSDRQREDLTDDDPGTWTPGGGEEEDVDADEGNLSLDSSRVATIHSAGNGHDKLADNHAESTPDHNGSATEPLDDVE